METSFIHLKQQMTGLHGELRDFQKSEKTLANADHRTAI